MKAAEGSLLWELRGRWWQGREGQGKGWLEDVAGVAVVFEVAKDEETGTRGELGFR